MGALRKARKASAMAWRRWLSRKADGTGARQGMEPSAFSHDQELIHSLHQSLDLCREAGTRGEPLGRLLIKVLGILRRLLDAPVAVARVDWPLETFFHVSTGNPASEDWLSKDRHFVRVCERLFGSPQPMLISDALEGSEFVDPRLRSQFPRPSILTTAWSLPGGEIKLAFLSHLPDHFCSDQITLLDYFGSLLLGVPYSPLEQNAACVA